MKGVWGLAEWYPNYRRKTAASEDAATAEAETSSEEEEKPKSATA
jgi:hypothetical protein